MHLSCHTWAFRDLLLPEALGTIARMGFRYVDLGSGAHLNIARAANSGTRAETLAEIRGDLALFNLKLADLYILLPRISINDLARRRTDLTAFRALVPFAKALGAPGITISPGLIHPEDDTAAWDRTVGALRDMVEAAQKADMPLSIEPHMDSMAQTPEQALRLVEAVEGLQITLDWATFAYQKIKPDAIVALLPHTRHVHLRQAASRKLQTPVAKGKIDLGDVIQRLQAAGYDGGLCVDFMPPADQHGLQKINPIIDSMALRDRLRDLV